MVSTFRSCTAPMSTTRPFSVRPATLFASTALLLTCLGSAYAADATLYGQIDLSSNYQHGDDDVSVHSVESGRMSHSFWGLRSGEDLGGGLRLSLQLEAYFRASTGQLGRSDTDALFSRSSLIAIGTPGLGQLSMGRQSTPLFANTTRFNPFADSGGFSPSMRHYFGGAANRSVFGDSRWDNSISYATPVFNGFWGGFSSQLLVSLPEGDANGGKIGANLMYMRGAFAMGFASQKVKANLIPGDEQSTWQLGGAYDIGRARAYAQYGQIHHAAADSTAHISSIGASLPLTRGRVLVAWGRSSTSYPLTRTGNAPVIQQDTFSLGNDVEVSKRTDIYVVFTYDRIDGLSATKSYSAGIRHQF